MLSLHFIFKGIWGLCVLYLVLSRCHADVKALFVYKTHHSEKDLNESLLCCHMASVISHNLLVHLNFPLFLH